MTYANLNWPRIARQACRALTTFSLLAGFCGLAVSLRVPPVLAGAPVQAPGNELAGTYRVEKLDDLGSELRVTLHIRLINNTAQDLGVNDFALRDLHQRARLAAIPARIRLQPREGTTLEHDFVVSRVEYESWNHRVRPTLEVRVQPAGGREVRRSIQLVRLNARRKP